MKWHADVDKKAGDCVLDEEGHWICTTDTLRAMQIEREHNAHDALVAFARDVVVDYFEYEEPLIGQCPLCLWVNDRDWDPVHDCSLSRVAYLLRDLAKGKQP